MARVAVLLAVSLVPTALAAIAADAVPTLPGYGVPPAPWYSGAFTLRAE